MSSSYYQSRVNRLVDDLADLERKVASERDRAAKERSAGLRASGSIRSSTSASTRQSKLREAQRREEAAVRHDRIAARLMGDMAKKQRAVTEARKQLARAESSERRQATVNKLGGVANPSIGDFVDVPAPTPAQPKTSELRIYGDQDRFRKAIGRFTTRGRELLDLAESVRVRMAAADSRLLASVIEADWTNAVEKWRGNVGRAMSRQLADGFEPRFPVLSQSWPADTGKPSHTRHIEWMEPWLREATKELIDFREAMIPRNRPRTTPIPRRPRRQPWAGRWQIVTSIGEGGQARTFRVRDQGDGSDTWVLKVLKNPARRERFRREVEALAKLRSDNVPAVGCHRDPHAERPVLD